MNAAAYVLSNLSAEIDAFARVVETMRRRFRRVLPDERAEVEEASRLLRPRRPTAHPARRDQG